MKKQSQTQRFTVITMLLGMALIINMIEPAFPIGVPGVKLGLANVLGLFAFYFYGPKEMLQINLMRVLIAGLLRGTFLGTGFWLAFFGALLSNAAIIIFSRFTSMSEIGISLVSATFHNVGQILVVMFITNNFLMITYLPIMLYLGLPTGYVTGYLLKTIVHRFPDFN